MSHADGGLQGSVSLHMCDFHKATHDINDHCIFGQDDKTKDDIDKKSNKDPHNLTAIPMHLN